jgi:hypothetical protein
MMTAGTVAEIRLLDAATFLPLSAPLPWGPGLGSSTRIVTTARTHNRTTAAANRLTRRDPSTRGIAAIHAGAVTW